MKLKDKYDWLAAILTAIFWIFLFPFMAVTVGMIAISEKLLDLKKKKVL